MRFVAPAGEAEFLERRVKEITGIVSGERPTGAVGAAQPGSKADDQQARVDGAEGGDGCIEPVRLAFAPSLAGFGVQPRAASFDKPDPRST